MRSGTPPFGRTLGRAAGALGPPGVALARRGLEVAERSLEPPPEVVAFLREEQPDVLLVAHVVLLDGGEADYLRAARRLGIRTAFPVRGWDNLTNKGLMRDAPDLVLVWNEVQAQEARELHAIPHENIRVTGSPKCDPLFDWTSRRSREEFCRQVGLDPAAPFVLYVGSSPFVAPREVGFVRRWIAALRAHGGVLAEAGILVRPHPRNAKQWADATLDEPQVAVWPKGGETPQDDASRDNYYDSIHHAAAVVGINTTAQIESAILGRPVHTVLDHEFERTQQGTLHFDYLKDDDYGHLIVGADARGACRPARALARGRLGPFARRAFPPRVCPPARARCERDADAGVGARGAVRACGARARPWVVVLRRAAHPAPAGRPARCSAAQANVQALLGHAEQLAELVGLRDPLEHEPRVVRGELLRRVPAGGDGDRAGADRLAALDVGRACRRSRSTASAPSASGTRAPGDVDPGAVVDAERAVAARRRSRQRS